MLPSPTATPARSSSPSGRAARSPQRRTPSECSPRPPCIWTRALLAWESTSTPKAGRYSALTPAATTTTPSSTTRTASTRRYGTAAYERRPVRLIPRVSPAREPGRSPDGSIGTTTAPSTTPRRAMRCHARAIARRSAGRSRRTSRTPCAVWMMRPVPGRTVICACA